MSHKAEDLKRLVATCEDDDLQDLRDEFMSQKNPVAFVKFAWEESEKNAAATNYIAGVIDAFRFAKKISLKEYNALYAKYVYRRKK